MKTAPPREATTAGPAATPERRAHTLLAALRAGTVYRVVAAYFSNQNGNFASSLAFSAFMAMFPMILGALAIIGLVVSGPGIQQQAQSAILRAFPGRSGAELSAVITQDLHHYAGLLGIVGILGLLWTGTNFFATLETCLGHVFEIGQRSFLRQRAMGAVMLLGLVAGLLIAVAANTLISLVPVFAGIGPLAGFLTMATLVLAIYRLVPSRTFHIRELWPGAVVAGLLIEAVTLLFPLYVHVAHGFDTYGQSLALFFLLATWIAFLSQFILLGALWNRIRLGERFTAAGLLAGGAGASPSAPGGHDAVAPGPGTPGGGSITGDMPRNTPSPLRRPPPGQAGSRP